MRYVRKFSSPMAFFERCESKRRKKPTQHIKIDSWTKPEFLAMIKLELRNQEEEEEGKNKSFLFSVLLQASNTETAPKLSRIEMLLDHFSFRHEIHLFVGSLCFWAASTGSRCQVRKYWRRCQNCSGGCCVLSNMGIIFTCAMMRERRVCVVAMMQASMRKIPSFIVFFFRSE